MQSTITRLLSLLALVTALSGGALVAQCHPIDLAEPLYWEIHKPTDDGGTTDLGYTIEVLLQDDGSYDLFTFNPDGTLNSWSWAIQITPEVYEVHNGDSGNVTHWEWVCDADTDTGHFEKVGGTRFERLFFPVY